MEEHGLFDIDSVIVGGSVKYDGTYRKYWDICGFVFSNNEIGIHINSDMSVNANGIDVSDDILITNSVLLHTLLKTKDSLLYESYASYIASDKMQFIGKSCIRKVEISAITISDSRILHCISKSIIFDALSNMIYNLNFNVCNETSLIDF